MFLFLIPLKISNEMLFREDKNHPLLEIFLKIKTGPGIREKGFNVVGIIYVGLRVENELIVKWSN